MGFPRDVHRNIHEQLANKIKLTDDLRICGTPNGAVFTSYISITENIPT